MELVDDRNDGDVDRGLVEEPDDPADEQHRDDNVPALDLTKHGMLPFERL
ncbi:hypothetical protein LZK82_10285 [Rhizobium leguminosarum]|nr:hypothetical protein LZK82_10285 [Rhizobium leguminosarum]